MSTQIIKADSNIKFQKIEGDDKLAISEFFCDTLQGEGVSAGVPAAFLRLKDCTLACTWCDTTEVWRHGREYSFDKLFQIMNHWYMSEKLIHQRLVLTGGSPLKQQQRLLAFIEEIRDRYGYYPTIEVENECVLEPLHDFILMTDQWNNSPKLSNSGMRKEIRYKPQLIEQLADLDNSWFKFVIDNMSDWREIEDDFLKPRLIDRRQIILMPQGMTQQQLQQKREFVAELAVRESVRFSDRLHVTLWNEKTGV